MNAFGIEEKSAHQWFERTTRALKAAEVNGVPLPQHLLGLAGVILTGNAEGALSRRNRLFLIVAFQNIYNELSQDLREAIERHAEKMTYAAPDFLPADISEDQNP